MAGPSNYSTSFPYEEKDLKIIGTRPDERPDAVDKVTGKARYAADINLPGQLVGKVLRSPHAHAWVRSIDTSAAEALPGVKAVVTRDDFPDMEVEHAASGELMINFRDVTRNMMAREKVLYDGHPVAAVAAVSESVAKRALKLIKVDYEVLPHVIDVEAAMAPDAADPARGAVHQGGRPDARQAVQHRHPHREQTRRHRKRLRGSGFGN